jgi:hypothetical protein
MWHVDPLLGNDRETIKTAVTRQRPVNSNRETVFSASFAQIAEHATMDTPTEERCFLCGPCLDVISSTIIESQCSSVEWSEVKSWLVSELENCSCLCKLLLWVAGSWGTGTVREPRWRGTPGIGSRYQTTTGEDTTDWDDLVRAVANCGVCELATVL